MVYPLLSELAKDLVVIEKPDSQGQVEADDDGLGDESGDEEYDSSVAAKLKRCIWEKLKKRFDLYEDGQPHKDVCKSCPLMIAAFCDPR